jgi:glucose-6-phosphate 1-dehydrogenase
MFEKLKLPNSCVLVIFGATGDLTHRKIMPALYKLSISNCIPKCFSVLAVARREKKDEDYRKDVFNSLISFNKKTDQKSCNEFLKKINYFRLDFDKEKGYDELKRYLDKIDKKNSTKGNRIFYMATIQKHVSRIIKNLKKNKFIARKSDKRYRIIIEKPFGKDLKSAEELNKSLLSLFKEKEIFRIDHYLGKESVQNLFALRFANRIFEPLWSKEHIDNIQITAAESIGIGTRAGYYDKIGALRDMVQNHLLQILSLTAMEPPKNFSTDAIKNQKVNVLKSVKLSNKDLKENVVLGQYIGYKEEEKVEKKSKTETFAALKLEIENNRWKGVPFYLKTGKYLKRKAAEVVVYFKESEINTFSHLKKHKQNVLVVRLQPDEGIYLRFNIKEPGNEFKIQRVSMDFCHNCLFGPNTPEAYEKLLYDVFLDDFTLFARWDEVAEAWKIIDPITKYWDKKQPYLYEKSSSGPKESENLLEKNGRHWRLPE